MTIRKYMKKICLLGDAAVGKTSLIRRYVWDIFDDKYITTFGAKVTTKRMNMTISGHDYHLTMIIWDILGQNINEPLHAGHYSGTRGAFIVCDLSRPDTIKNVRLWMDRLTKYAGTVPVLLLGNKCDITSGGSDLLGEISQDLRLPFKLTSAKTGLNVEDAFAQLGIMMLEDD